MTTIARVGSRLASQAAWAKAQSIFTSRKPDVPPDRSREIRSTQDVARELGSMRGVMAKFGQMLSYVSTPLNAELRESFATLQDSAPPMSNELVEEVFTEEFGILPEALFAAWDRDPIASASIGQVHRAITHSGIAVAVKVQYPGIRETLGADLSNLRLIAKGFRFAFPAMDTDAIVEEIATRITEELDYVNEARNQEEFYRFYHEHPFISIPKVLQDHSTSRVLVSELGAGMRFAQLLQENQSERDLAGETIFRFVFRSLYQLRSFNGDPHPGNYLFDGQGRVTFLDFGLTKHFAPNEIELFESMIRAMVIERSPAEFRSAIARAGLLRDDCALDDQQIYQHFIPFYDSVLTDEEFIFNDSYTTNLFAHTFDQRAPIAKYLMVSPPFVVIQRINLGLYSILASLEARGNFRRIAEEIWPFVRGTPSTPLGALEAAWLTDRDSS